MLHSKSDGVILSEAKDLFVFVVSHLLWGKQILRSDQSVGPQNDAILGKMAHYTNIKKGLVLHLLRAMSFLGVATAPWQAILQRSQEKFLRPDGIDVAAGRSRTYRYNSERGY